MKNHLSRTVAGCCMLVAVSAPATNAFDMDQHDSNPTLQINKQVEKELLRGFVSVPAPAVLVFPYITPLDLYRVRLGDFNGDGLTDIYKINGWQSTVNGTIFLFQSNGSFKSINGPPLYTGSEVEIDLDRVKLGDFNGDGLDDIYYIQGWGATAKGDIWLSHGDGTWSRVDAPALWVANDDADAKIDLGARVHLADFNGDGTTDIFHINGAKSVEKGVIYLSQLSGDFTAIDGPALYVGSLTEVDLDRVHLGDFNGDGLLDVYYINGWGNTAVGDVWLNHGDGAWNRIAGPALWACCNGDVDLVGRINISDFNGDGLADIHHINGSNSSAKGTIYLAQPDGSFRTIDGPTLYTGGDALFDLHRVHLCDFDGDGLDDVYFVNGNGGASARGDIWLNGGDGRWDRVDAPSVSVGNNVDLNRVRPQDFDGNGLCDIYHIEGWGNSIPGEIYLNQGGSEQQLNRPIKQKNRIKKKASNVRVLNGLYLHERE